jgi:hypothetical protein
MEARGQLHVPVAFTPYPFNAKLQRFESQKTLLTQPGTEPRFLAGPVCSLATVVTELSRIHDWFN